MINYGVLTGFGGATVTVSGKLYLRIGGEADFDGTINGYNQGAMLVDTINVVSGGQIIFDNLQPEYAYPTSPFALN